MSTKAKASQSRIGTVKRYEIQYPLTAYTFPSDARIHAVRFDEEYIHIELMDGRMLSIPLWWIPTLYNASAEEREKYVISRDRTMLIWDPEQCEINDELRVADYLVVGKGSSTPASADSGYTSRESGRDLQSE
ncbi:MAG: DUF2442 domain-containing protein [Chloroflexi bacterium]|nr:MAG: DUF2442 domain-containing protein [Chloroflexota bacterium]